MQMTPANKVHASQNKLSLTILSNGRTEKMKLFKGNSRHTILNLHFFPKWFIEMCHTLIFKNVHVIINV